ncbi:hypothetical protein Tco_1568694 [Tanacetum coccineum]
MSSYNHFGCSWCGGPFNGGNCPGCSSVGSGNEFVYDPNPYSYNETPDFSYPPPQPQYETYSCELCGNDSHYGFDCPPWVPLKVQELLNKLLEDVQNISEELAESINSPSWSRHAFYLDDDEEYTIAITPDLPTEELEYSLSMGDEHLDTIPATESDEVIKSSVENLVPIPSEFEVTSDNESECDRRRVISDEDVSKRNIPNPLFDEEIISDKIDALIISSPKIDSLLEQFFRLLALRKSLIPTESFPPILHSIEDSDPT